ncbi:hypothetical protein [Actinoplanes xinjiangensis]|jgi:hypothetical protein|uniref:Uncharacterized protein n=1 Tax=Actinoplanes xinjiangensis TaxID=512350 RepID=A0A316GA88_9ACTN|nr:hypothetical protein [Actinoplanes xinjiangensis]PWK51417.1 hypothetical protein BC793_102446 [Actinoplanes xinjiangensis]GIF35775.1 hypothetical protein Axi01nite_00860 [Actinoplanes xinjiangensis]
MTAIDSLTAGSLPALRSPARWNRPLLWLTAASAVLALISLTGIFVDDRILTGVPIWLKPFKFAVSFVFYAWTLAWMLAVLPRRSRPAEWSGTVILGVAVVELAIIVTQVIRGTTSHFNVSSPLDETLWNIMGPSIMVLFIAQVVIAVAVLRQRIPDRPAAFAIRLGLGISLLGMMIAFLMTSQVTDTGLIGAHSVGVPDGGPSMPVTGWSTTGGDLRISHFVGLHALQAIPLLAFGLGRWTRLRETVRARLVLIGGSAYAVLVILLTWQALRAQPLLEPDGTTLAAFAALAVVTAVASVAATRGRA